MGQYEKKLTAMGIQLPTVPPPAGAYIPAVQTGNLIFCSGQGPYKEGRFTACGRLGSELSLEQGYQAAKVAALNCLAEIVTVTGSIDKIKRIVHVRGFVNSAPDFFDQPKVVNGASELLHEIFGPAGQHARAALGVSTLPLNIAVEVEMVVEV